MISSRRLTLADQQFFERVDEWREAYPKRFLQYDALDGPTHNVWETADNPDYVYIGIEDDGEPVALLLYRHSGDGWVEAHLESRRGAKFLAELHAVAFEWGWGLFEIGAVAIYAWALDSNRVSATAIKVQGLTYDGTVRWRGVFRGKIVKSRRYTLERSTWLRWKEAALRESNGQTETGRNQNHRDAEPAVQSAGHAGSD